MTHLDYSGISEIVDFVTQEHEQDERLSTTKIFKLDRRQFLKFTGVVGGGLMLGVGVKTAAVSDSGATFQPNGFIKIDQSGIQLFAKNPEIGQGVKTSLPMIVAEELDAHWKTVEVIQAPINMQVYGAQFAGGSMSIPMNWTSLRQAGAVARSMLVEAASKRWGVEPANLRTKFAEVYYSLAQATYKDLASEASKLPIPSPDSVKLKSRDSFRLLGKRITGVDNEALMRGEALFGIDQQVEGMKYAVYQKAPAIGGKVSSANTDDIKQMPGVVDAFVLEGNGSAMELLPGVAIVAENTYAAFKAKAALKIDWDLGEASQDSWTSAKSEAKKLVEMEGPAVVNSGDVKQAFESGTSKVSGFYEYQFVSHATLEPMNCTASFKDGKLELWAPTQTPSMAPASLARVVGIAPSDITLNQVRCGGGFGRRLYNDFMCEAAAITKQAGVPVKLLWTREDDMAYDLYRAGGFHQMEGSVDADGKITGWKDRFITFTNDGDKPVPGGGISPTFFPSGLVDNVRVEQTALPWSNRCAAWRAPGSNVFGFVVMSFLDELAKAAGRDYLDVLLETFGLPRQLGPRGMHTGRAAEVVKLAAEKAGWGREKTPGRGLGLAFYYSHAGHIAEVADVSVSDDKAVKVHKVTVAADVGPIVNLSGAENQVEGSVVDGLSTMFNLGVTFEDGRIEQSNFDKYAILRMPATPEIDVHFIESDYPPTGLGEPALPPLAPAVCNAIFEASGHRVRTMPLREEGFTLVG